MRPRPYKNLLYVAVFQSLTLKLFLRTDYPLAQCTLILRLAKQSRQFPIMEIIAQKLIFSLHISSFHLRYLVTATQSILLRIQFINFYILCFLSCSSAELSWQNVIKITRLGNKKQCSATDSKNTSDSRIRSILLIFCVVKE